MKIKMTFTKEGLIAGNTYDLDPEEAMRLISEEKAIAAEEQPVEKPKRKVKHDNG